VKPLQFALQSTTSRVIVNHKMHHPNQITLRGLDPRVRRELHALARKERISLNKAALRLLEKGAGVIAPRGDDQIGDSLDPWIGTWSQEEADEVLDSIQSCAQVDPELWE